jgi:ribose transport system permease protein
VTTRYGVPIILIVLIVGFSILRPETFMTLGSFRSLIAGEAVVVILGLTATVVLRAGDFDLSIAGMMICSVCVVGSAAAAGVSPWVSILLGLAFAVLGGVINGFLIVSLGLNSFVTTLAMMIILSGISMAVTDSNVISSVPEPISSFASERFWGLPAAVYYGWALALVVWYVYERTPLGRYLLFTGGNADAARLIGVPVQRIRFGAFVVSAVLAFFAGLVLASTIGAIDPTSASQYLLSPFVAAFLGSTCIHVDRFNSLGTVLAVYLVAVGITGLQLLGASFWVSDVFNGATLIAAIAVAHLGSVGARRIKRRSGAAATSNRTRASSVG